MTWTYSNSDLSTDLAQVRFLIQDTNTKRQLLSDEEITWLLAQNGGIYATAAEAASVIAAHYGRQIDRSAIDVQDSASARAAFYQTLATKLKMRANLLVDVFAGGRTISGKEDLAADTDAIQPAFDVGMDDYASSQNSSYGRWDDSD